LAASGSKAPEAGAPKRTKPTRNMIAAGVSAVRKGQIPKKYRLVLAENENLRELLVSTVRDFECLAGDAERNLCKVREAIKALSYPLKGRP
jgi:hypothetical protein